MKVLSVVKKNSRQNEKRIFPLRQLEDAALLPSVPAGGFVG